MTNRLLISRLFIFALAGLLSACGSEDDASATKTIHSGEPEKRNGEYVLRKGNGAEPESLDPHKAQSVGSSEILRDMYEGLVSEAPDGELIPGVAERWEVSEDGLTYTFRIRADAAWSNGDAVTAEDFAWSLRRAVDPATGSSYSEILAPIKNAKAVIAGKKPVSELGVEVVGEKILQITLRAPTPYFIGLLTHSMAYPVHRSSVEKHGDRFTQVGNHVSNGAYVIDEWVVSSHILLKRNERYRDAASTRIGYVKYLPIDNAESELKRYRAGELDWTASIPLGHLEWAKKNLPDEYQAHPYLGVYYYGLNTTRPPFKDNPKLRRALSIAVDRQLIVDKVSRGGEIPAYAWVPPGVNNYQNQPADYADLSREEQIALAQKLYSEAGYSQDNPAEIEIRYNTSEGHKKIASAIASFWKDHLGAKVTLINEEWKVFLTSVKEKKKTQAYRSGWIGDYNDAFTFLELMHGDFGLNGAGYNSDEYDRLLDQASVEGDADKRRALMQQAEQVLMRDQPVIPIYFYVNKGLVKPWVKGIVGNVMDHHYSKNLWIEPSPPKG